MDAPIRTGDDPLPRSADLVVIGAGVVGLATARAAQERFNGLRVVVLDKERTVAAHQSSRNSGVLHSGIYYPPGSLKATLCIEGAAAMADFCERHAVPHARTGKLIVAHGEDQERALEILATRGEAHGLAVQRLSGREVRQFEPHVVADRAIHVAETGVVDFGAVSRALASAVERSGGSVHTATAVTSIVQRPEGRVLHTSSGSISTTFLVNCAGLHSDHVAALDGVTPDVRIVAFRGEYFSLRPRAAALVRGLVYPVPDPGFPFLGVHLTRDVHGAVHAGPNAVPALAREGYRWRDIDLSELAATAADPGFRRLARRHLGKGAGEVWRSLWRGAFLRELRGLVPALRWGDLVRAPAGVRAQALRSDGTLVDDFLVERHAGAVHVLNAPSPAATSSLAIGRHIASLLERA